MGTRGILYPLPYSRACATPLASSEKVDPNLSVAKMSDAERENLASNLVFDTLKQQYKALIAEAKKCLSADATSRVAIDMLALVPSNNPLSANPQDITRAGNKVLELARKLQEILDRIPPSEAPAGSREVPIDQAPIDVRLRDLISKLMAGGTDLVPVPAGLSGSALSSAQSKLRQARTTLSVLDRPGARQLSKAESIISMIPDFTYKRPAAADTSTLSVPMMLYKNRTSLEIARELVNTTTPLVNCSYYAHAQRVYDLALYFLEQVKTTAGDAMNGATAAINSAKNDIKSAEAVLRDPQANNAAKNAAGRNREAALKRIDTAIMQIEAAKNQITSASKSIAAVENGEGQLDYYYTGNVARAFAHFSRAIIEPFCTNPEDAFNDALVDMKRFMFSFIKIGVGMRHEDGRDTQAMAALTNAQAVLNDPKSTEAQRTSARQSISEAMKNIKRPSDRKEIWAAANFNMNGMYPYGFEGLGVVDLSLNAAYTDHMGTRKEYYDPLITQADIDKNTNAEGVCVLPPALIKERNIRHVLLDLHDSVTAGAVLNHAIPMYKGPFGTLPLELYRLFPKMNVGLGYGITQAHATLYKDPKFNGQGFDFTSEPVMQTTKRGVLYLSTDTGSIIRDPEFYSESEYWTPQFGYMRVVEQSAVESIYSFIPPNSRTTPHAAYGSSWWAGFRVNTKRYPSRNVNNEIRNDTSRVTWNVRFQVDQNPLRDAEGRTWPLGTKNAVQSVHLGMSWEYGMLMGTSDENKAKDNSSVKLTFPFSVSGGFTDINGATGSVNTWETRDYYKFWKKESYALHAPRAYYVSLSAGVKFRAWTLMYEYSTSNNGIPFYSTQSSPNSSSAHRLSVGREW